MGKTVKSEKWLCRNSHFRVISWIDFGVKLKAIHELIQTTTKHALPRLISYSFSVFCRVVESEDYFTAGSTVIAPTRYESSPEFD